MKNYYLAPDKVAAPNGLGMRRSLANVLPATTILLVVAAGCAPKPAELRQRAVQAEVEARQAFEHREAAAAGRAADRAEDAATRLEKQVSSKRLSGAEAATFLQAAHAAADSARNYAQLADEERQSRERLASLKLKAYRTARTTVCSYGFAGLAPAAEHFAGAGTNSLSSTEQQLAMLAWSIVKLVEEPPPTTNGAPDWASVAADLRGWSKEPPPGLGMFLSAAFALNGFTDFALSELESVDATKLSATNARALYHLERSALFAAHGWDKTAARELDQAARLAPPGWLAVGSTQAVALSHVWLAGAALQRREFRRAEQEIAMAVKAWPNSAVAAFITGEELAARGEWEKAADSLDARAANTREEWLAKRLAQRARDLRNSQGTAPSLFSDSAFVMELALHAFGESAADSAPAKWFQQFLADAKAFGQRVVGQLPRGDAGG
jgi:hypothetical protein